MAWSAWRTYEISGDKAWLERIYTPLTWIYTFWFKYHASPRGLAMWYNGAQIADNDARFDPCFEGKERGNENFTGFESPDINAFFIVELDRYARMAEVLGKPDEAAVWRRDRDDLAKKIVDFMYFPEHTMFFDVAIGTRNIFSGCKGPNMFLPIWAGVPLPEKEIHRIIETHMLNPAEFFGPRPFPSLSYDDPKFDPLGYWRGRVWPHIGALMLEILWKFGYEKEAEQAASWYIDLYAKSPWLHECFAGSETETREVGVPGQSWAAATVVRLLLQRYRTDHE
jgi:glycogen debranching enzyme